VAFLKAIWRFIVGVKDLLVLCFLLIFFAGLYGALSMAGGERPVKTSQGALLISLNGIVVEQPQITDPIESFLTNQTSIHEYRLRDIVMVLEAARTDDNVKAVVLDLGGFMGGGQVALSRIGEAIDAVRAAKKPVLTYATFYEDDGYQLAAHASEIWLDPLGGVALTGLGGSRLYYKGLIDKLGITANIYRVGTYKSAVEPFMLTGQSEAAKENSRILADGLWQNWQAEVKQARPNAAIQSYSSNPVEVVEAAKGNFSTAALAAKLVDKVGTPDMFDERVAEIAGESEDGKDGFAAIGYGDYIRANRPANDGEIGVLTIAGEIIDGKAGPGVAGGTTIANQLEEALDDKKLKALVLRIDSPGGSVLASEHIRRAILAAKAKGLPVVTSMGNVAASGGYWVSTPSDHVFAEPSTITGSIGVFGVIPSFEGTLAKLGVSADGVKTTPLSGEPDFAKGFGPEFDRLTQLGVEDIYSRFLGYVGKARNMEPDKVNEIAQGRVWAGGSAHQLGLIDQFGGLDDAIAEAARLAKRDPKTAKPYYIEAKPDPFEQFITQWLATAPAQASHTDLLSRQAYRQEALLARALADAQMLVSSGSVQASCLECRAYIPVPKQLEQKSGIVAHLLSLFLTQ